MRQLSHIISVFCLLNKANLELFIQELKAIIFEQSIKMNQSLEKNL